MTEDPQKPFIRPELHAHFQALAKHFYNRMAERQLPRLKELYEESKGNVFLTKQAKDTFQGVSEDLAICLMCIQQSLVESLAQELAFLQFQEAGLVENLPPMSSALQEVSLILSNFDQGVQS